jgi:hypothetical protein
MHFIIFFYRQVVRGRPSIRVVISPFQTGAPATFQGRDPPQNPVAMRESPEARYDISMFARVTKHLGKAIGLHHKLHYYHHRL